MEALALHGYQADGLVSMVEAVQSRAWRRYGVVWATGAGKTAFVLVFLSVVHRAHYTHVVVVSTQKHIRDAFCQPSCRLWKDPSGTYFDITPIIPEVKSLKGIRDYLKSPIVQDQVAACCNNTLVRLTQDLEEEFRKNPECCKGRLLVLDEAHWDSADGMGAFVALWEKAGGETMKLTATPDRGDGRPVLLPNTHTIVRTLSQQMHGGKYAPSQLKHEIVPVGGPCEYDPDCMFIPVSLEAIQKMVDCWVKDGNPKTIVRIRNFGLQQENVSLVKALKKAFEKAGARVLDATGPANGEVLRRELLAERSIKNYSESKWDVIIGIQRVAEGLDWPICSHVYVLGIPRRLPTISQVVGRGMRFRALLAGYPEAWRDASKVVLFASAVKDMKAAHAEHTLLLSCFLSDYNSSDRWTALKELTALLEEHGTPTERVAAAVEVGVPDEARAEINKHWVKYKNRCGGDDLDKRPTPKQVKDHIRSALEQEGNQEALKHLDTVIMEGFANDNDQLRKKYLGEYLVDRQRGMSMTEAHRRALETVSKEFQDEALEHPSFLSEVEGNLESQILNTTGERMDKFAERMKQLVPNLKARDVLESILHWMRLNRTVPDPRRMIREHKETVQTVLDRDPRVPGLETFAGYHESLRYGERGLQPRVYGMWQLLAEGLEKVGRDWVDDYAEVWRAVRGRRKFASHRLNALDEEDFINVQACAQDRPDFVWYGKAFFVAEEVGWEAAREIGLRRAYELATAAKSRKRLSEASEKILDALKQDDPGGALDDLVARLKEPGEQGVEDERRV